MEPGLHGMGEYARRQLAAADRDPRLDRRSGHALADFLDYLDEADRVRSLAAGAIESLIDRQTASDDMYERQAAWERAELARHEQANGHPHLNALTLVGMLGNLDGLVEQLAPAARHLTIEVVAARAIQGALERLSCTDEAPSAEFVSALRMATEQTLQDLVPEPGRPRGPGPKRWDKVLLRAGLPPLPDHPVPQPMANALNELTALRNVLVHRAGRIDEGALKESPRLATHLNLKLGQFVRIDRSGYRRYSAAVRSYGLEVQRRLFAKAEIPMELNLDHWENNYYAVA